MLSSPRARLVGLGAEVAQAFGVGAAAFVLVAAILAAADSLVVALALGLFCVFVVIRIMGRWGVAYGVPAAMAALLAYDWFEIPPTHAVEIPDAANLGDLVAYLAVAGFVGTLAAHTRRRADLSEQSRSALAAEQAALRRVATLVAERPETGVVCEAVVREIGQLLDVDVVHMGRYDDDTVTLVASWNRAGGHLPVGVRAGVAGHGVSDLVRRTACPARIDDQDAPGDSSAELLRQDRVRSAVGAPIVVDGALWGVMIASTSDERALPVDAESRVAGLTELAATAISNMEAWAEAHRLAGEQASLRRVATLVAREAPPSEVFGAVAEEVARLLGVDGARMWRFEADGEATVLAAWGKLDIPARTGARVTPEPHSISAQVRRTGAPARVAYDDPSDPRTADARAAGVQAAIGTPIVVDGRLWGAMVVGTTHHEPLPADTGARVAEFTELIAMAISNLQARSELAASRARIVAAADEERRRVVRDLHDGAQQRLVQTVLTLKLADRELAEFSGQGPELVGEALDQAEQAMVELRELARGILPSALTRGGLRAGVDVLVAKMPMPVENRVTGDRLPGAIEATAYFVVAEALTNVAKHARASAATVTASVEDGALYLEVRDDGVGGARAEGHGLVGLADRLAVLDGTLLIESPRGQGTLAAAVIPLRC